jgi:hypothetical protein
MPAITNRFEHFQEWSSYERAIQTKERPMNSRTRREKMITIARAVCMTLFAFVALATPAAAQSGALATESAGFDTVGFIQAATIDHPIGTAGDLLSGGVIKVNGHVIIVPALCRCPRPRSAGDRSSHRRP